MSEPKGCAIPGCCAAVDEIATLRAENDRLVDEAYNARQSAKGENALRLEAERERDTLRAEVERRVKEIAHLKLSAEKAERERMRELEVARALSLAGDDMESEGDRVAFLKKCETIIEEIEIDMQAAKELSFEPAPNGSVQGPERA